jgi:hypothetical protein
MELEKAKQTLIEIQKLKGTFLSVGVTTSAPSTRPPSKTGTRKIFFKIKDDV